MKSPGMQSVDRAIDDLATALDTAQNRVRRLRSGGTITRDACGSADRQPMRPIIRAVDDVAMACDRLQMALGLDLAECPYFRSR